MIENFELNKNLFYWINSFAGKNDFLDKLFVFLAEDLIYILIFLFIIYFSKQIWRDKKIELIEFIIYFSTSILAWIMAKIIKISFPTERPFSALESVVKLSNESIMSSFPSGHSTLSFALAVSVLIYNKKIGILFLALAFLIAISRSLVGVHYPLDTIVGAILGILIALALGNYLKNKYVK